MEKEAAVGLDEKGNPVLLKGKLTFETASAGGRGDPNHYGEPLVFRAGERLPDCCTVTPTDAGQAMRPDENASKTRAKLRIEAGGAIGHIGEHDGDTLIVRLETEAAVDIEVSGYRKPNEYRDQPARNVDVVHESDAPGSTKVVNAGCGTGTRRGTGEGNVRLEDVRRASAYRFDGPGNAEIGPSCGPDASADRDDRAPGNAVCEAAFGYAYHWGKTKEQGTGIRMDGAGKVLWEGRLEDPGCDTPGQGRPSPGVHEHGSGPERPEATIPPVALPDRGGGHAPGASAQQQERSGPTR